MELKLQEIKTTPVVFNYEELKLELTNNLKAYKNYVVTEENLKTAQSDIAKLNKLKKLLNDKKIEVKKQFLKEYEPFEVQIKDLLGIIDDACSTIKNQADKFEEERVKEKMNKIEEIFNRTNNTNISLGKIYNLKWENKTYSFKDIEKEIQDQINKINDDLTTIDNFTDDEEARYKIKASYYINLNLSEAISSYKKWKQELEQIKNQQNKPAIEQKANESVITPTTIETSNNEPKTSEKQYTCAMSFVASKDNLVKLKNFLTENNINYTIIENMKEVK